MARPPRVFMSRTTAGLAALAEPERCLKQAIKFEIMVPSGGSSTIVARLPKGKA